MLKYMVHLHASLTELLTVLKLWRKIEGNDAIFSATITATCEEIYNLMRKANIDNDEAKALFNKYSNNVERKDIGELYGMAIGIHTELI
jgi:hypothetical protein